MQSIINKVVARIYGNGRGWVFSQIDFIDLGSRSSIDWALQTLLKRSTICRILRGIYYYPQESKLLKEQLPPEIPLIAQALSRKFGWETEPSGETALNILGISTQVPSKYIYISSGRSISYQIDNRELRFKKGMLKEVGFKCSESAILVQALRAYGKENLNSEQLKQFRKAIDPKKYSSVLKDTRSVTGWIYQAIQMICNESI